MNKMENRENVSAQYASDKNLSIRIHLHRKYSTSKIPVADWFFSHYAIDRPCRILELGCGNANQWTEETLNLPEGSIVVLSDLSQGMVDATWGKVKDRDPILVQRMDIQEIPFPDGSFDRVIANHMLYHVPDLDKALGEVQRVLAPQGIFFAATNGSGGMRGYLREKLRAYSPKIDAFSKEWNFTLQNGKARLDSFFSSVEMVPYEDALSITETQDLVDWIYSAIDVAEIDPKELNGLFDFFEDIRLREGVIYIPKEMGMFICRK